MSKLLNPDFTKSFGNVHFTLYDKFDICLPIEHWRFMCEKRWFSDYPDREAVEAEFGLYGARRAKSSEEAQRCVMDCVTDIEKIIMPSSSAVVTDDDVAYELLLELYRQEKGD